MAGVKRSGELLSDGVNNAPPVVARKTPRRAGHGRECEKRRKNQFERHQRAERAREVVDDSPSSDEDTASGEKKYAGNTPAGVAENEAVVQEVIEISDDGESRAPSYAGEAAGDGKKCAGGTLADTTENDALLQVNKIVEEARLEQIGSHMRPDPASQVHEPTPPPEDDRIAMPLWDLYRRDYDKQHYFYDKWYASATRNQLRTAEATKPVTSKLKDVLQTYKKHAKETQESCASSVKGLADIYEKSSATKDAIRLQMQHQLREANDEVKVKDGQLKAKGDQLKAKDGQLKAKNGQLKAKDDQLKAKDDEIAALKEEIASLNGVKNDS